MLRGLLRLSDVAYRTPKRKKGMIQYTPNELWTPGAVLVCGLRAHFKMFPVISHNIGDSSSSLPEAMFIKSIPSFPLGLISG